MSNKFYEIRFVHCNNTRIFCTLQQVSGQIVGSKQTRNTIRFCDSNIPFPLLNESLILTVQYVFKIYDLMHSWLIRVLLVDDRLHTNMTHDAFNDLFSVETLCRQ